MAGSGDPVEEAGKANSAAAANATGTGNRMVVMAEEVGPEEMAGKAELRRPFQSKLIRFPLVLP
jgi:hypothetical protein